MRANVRIVTRRVERVVTVPAECIFQRDGHAVVYVEANGGYRARRVKPGASNGDYTAIANGLKQGERVALNALGAAAPEAPGSERSP
jgi:multidrug efflux pump subunit AcrA (membrane-fusion protein)